MLYDGGKMQTITLSSSCLKIEILPERGACITNALFSKNGNWLPFLRPTDILDSIKINNTALFPMVPFCNRIRGGNFVYFGITRKMAKNYPTISDPIHGDGWLAKWDVVASSSNAVTLRYQHKKENGGFPFSYTAELQYSVAENTFSVHFSIKNDFALPMPCGFGVHPCFLKEKNTVLQFKAPVIWSNETDQIHGKPYLAAKEWIFEEGKALGKKPFDTCFGGFDGVAKITYPDKDLSIKITADEQFGHLYLYAPARKNYFYVEPATNATDAFNLAFSGIAGTGIKSIGPFETAEGSLSFTLS